ncbi:hypothetical protein AA309_25140 [Microvirga vignae]|uniref:Uncharacterized protein n=1 Tax=Microvirga vignae TaxID=1225564 RepID=A0A0H1R5X2_9HYPH|nr:hypothetical protein [Microvirga vignae]KLK90543.1 hypothetical protein AA309_25140 [Microvirga vignae]
MNQSEIEAVARALYEIQDGVRGWDREPERLKTRFRRDAQTAIAMLNEADRNIRASQSSARPRDVVVFSEEPDNE